MATNATTVGLDQARYDRMYNHTLNEIYAEFYARCPQLELEMRDICAFRNSQTGTTILFDIPSYDDFTYLSLEVSCPSTQKNSAYDEMEMSCVLFSPRNAFKTCNDLIKVFDCVKDTTVHDCAEQERQLALAGVKDIDGRPIKFDCHCYCNL